MNYLMQINAFKKKRRLEPIGSGSICLYYVLLEYANSLGFPEDFSVQNQIIAGICSMSMSKFIRSRDELVDKGYIKYIDGKRGVSAGKYQITELVFEERAVTDKSFGLGMTSNNKYKRKEYLNKRDIKVRETEWHNYDIDKLEKAARKAALAD